MIKIITGSNGSGKSFLLRKLAIESINKKRNTIVISTSLTDRFNPNNKKNYSYMGPGLGRNCIEKSLKLAFANSENDPSILSNTIANIFKYAGLSGGIGFRVICENSDKSYILSQESDKNIEIAKKFENHMSLIKNRSFFEFGHYDDPIIWLGENMDDEFIYTNKAYEIIPELLKNESAFKKLKLIKRIELVVSGKNDALPVHIAREIKKSIFIPLKNLSSGELSLISTSIFIASFIKQNTILLIDEPENSLHPEWQRNYISNLLNLFPYYDLEINIATHSPMIISSGSNEENIHIFKYDGKEFKPVPKDIKNIEQSYLEQFGVLTPQSSFLAENCVQLINNVNLDQVSLSDALDGIDRLKTMSNDDTQIYFLDNVKGLLKKANELKNAKN